MAPVLPERVIGALGALDATVPLPTKKLN